MKFSAARFLPASDWITSYRTADFSGDLTAGTITAIMLAPQAMAYAMLAGLPPQTGLYASIIPLLLYAMFGSSRTLAVGPVALVSLLTANAIGVVAEQGSASYLEAALILAGLVGAMNIALGLLRAGFLVNFLSHPVISGFTSAAALVIGFSQLTHILGVPLPRSHNLLEIFDAAANEISNVNLAAVIVAISAIIFLVFFKTVIGAALKAFGARARFINTAAKAAPLFLVGIATLMAWSLALDETQNIAVVGAIPKGLPALALPEFNAGLWRTLAPAALLITVVGFLESVSVAKALAGKRREKIDPNREFIGLGAANLGSALSGGYPVTGGFSRSIVNFQAGAATPLASIITAILVGLTVMFLTPLFYFLPKAALAAIIIVAVSSLIDWRTPLHLWRYDRADAASLIVTFAAVLTVGVEIGIIVGVVFSLLIFLWRTAQPHIAIIGRISGTEHFRNISRHTVETDPNIVIIRVDENLYFANSNFLEQFVIHAIAENAAARHLVINCNAINSIDGSALDSLEMLIENLRDAGVTLHLAAVKGPIMDRLKRTDFLERLAPGKIFLSTHEAMRSLQESAQQTAREGDRGHAPEAAE